MPECSIPPHFHFVYALLPDAPFGLVHYLAVRSAADLHPGASVTLHHAHEPDAQGQGWWAAAKALLQLRRVEVPLHIHGRPLRHHAHQADVLRLQILLEHGGIYLDMDTIVVRPLLPAQLQTTAALLGIQDSPRIYAGSTRAHARARFYGLCNAVVGAAPGSPFVARWLASYDSFNGSLWDMHSVRMPAELYEAACPGGACPPAWPGQRDCSLVRVLDADVFFTPLWNTVEADLFSGNRSHRCGFRACSFADFPHSRVIHLWASHTETVYSARLRNLAVERGWFRHTFYGELARRHIRLASVVSEGFGCFRPLARSRV